MFYLIGSVIVMILGIVFAYKIAKSEHAGVPKKMILPVIFLVIIAAFFSIIFESRSLFVTSENTKRTSADDNNVLESEADDTSEESSAYDDFKSLSAEEQQETFSNMSSREIYDMVKNSPESWPVDAYDKITPDNAKDFIVLNTNASGETSFNLDWPKYGGYEPKTISSISELSGKIEVSRDGGDSGYTMSIGRNEDGSYADNSMRSIPKSSAEVNTGTFDVDQYKKSVDIVSADISEEEKTAKLMDMGFDEDSADNMLRDYENWKTRPEIVGEDNIAQGFQMANPDKNLDMKYGVYGKTAKWDAGGVHMEGGAGQMNTVYSWGTCRDSGIITNCGKAKID